MEWFSRPVWLALLLPAGLAIWLAERFLREAQPWRVARVGLRILIAICAVLAAAGAKLPLKAGAGRPPCVLAVDVSRSMGRLPSKLAKEVIEALPAGQPFAVMAFAGAPKTFVAPPNADISELDVSASSLDRSSTDIAGGIRSALGLIGERARGAVVLISDGQDTSPGGLAGALGAALECRKVGVPIFAIAPGVDPIDARVEAVSSPASIEAGRPVPVAAVISASSALDVVVSAVRQPGGVELGTTKLSLTPGARMSVAFQDQSAPSGIVRYEVELRAEGDEFPENDRAASATVVKGKPRILVAPQGPAAELLGLAGERFEILTTSPAGLPVSAESLLGFAAVILDGAGRAEVGAAAEKALATYVRTGGALLALGGQNAFGAGGWRDEDALSEVLPVKMSPGPSEKAFVIFLIDASGSMAEGGSPGRSKLDDAKDALEAALPALAAEDELAIVAFRESAEILVEGVKAAQKDELLERVRTLRAFGKTSLEAALRAALELLHSRRAALRAAVMLSDGEPTVEPPGEPLFELARELRRSGGTLHAIGTSPTPTHRELLLRLAKEGGGTSEFETSFTRLGEAMRKAFARATGRFTRPGPVRLVRTGSSQGVLEGLTDLPELGAVNRTELRPSASAALEASSGEPVLAFLDVGAGKSAAFCSSFGGNWAGGLADWPGRLRLLTQIIREISPPPPEEAVAIRPVRTPHGLEMEISVADTGGAPRNLLDLSIELRHLAQDLGTPPQLLRARQVGLGTYRAELPAGLSHQQVLVVRVLEGSPPRQLLRAPMVLPPELEVLKVGRDLPALDAIASASGGRLLSSPSDLSEPLASLYREEWQDGAPAFAAVALALVVIELAARVFVRARRAPGRFFA